VEKRRSTISKTVMPVGQSTRELFARLRPWMIRDEVLDILADADVRDPYAVGNLLYAWRTGQLA
jgi:hypothetical protein